MKNNEGFITLGIIVAVLIISMILIGIFYKPMISTTMNVKKSEDIVDIYINANNGKERLYSTLRENISYQGKVKFEDVENEYDIMTSNEEYENIELNFNNNYNTFNINNQTDIELYFQMVPINPELSHSYDISLTVNGIDVLEKIDKTNLTNGVTINIDKNFTYNEENNETNYGEYKLSLNKNNCDVNVSVKFRELKNRKINVLHNYLNNTATIQNDNDNIDIYFAN